MDNNSDKKEYENYFSEIEKRLSDGKRDSTEAPRQRSRTGRKNKKAVMRVWFLRLLCLLIIAVFVIVIPVLVFKACSRTRDSGQKSTGSETATVRTVETEEDDISSLFAQTDGKTLKIGEEIKSRSVAFIDVKNNRVVAEKNMNEKMFPASTTKVMTLLVAVENIKDFDDTFTMTYQITDPLFKQGATVAGFSAGEVVNMNDLLYGTILPSGGDAAIGLAEKISGSEEEFVGLMNKKVKELGLESTHFQNCTGLFDKDNYTTAYELSVILRAAIKNPLCRKILSTQKYTTSKTEKHPDGLELENTLFKYMYGTEPETAVIKGGKTGFVSESGYCIASFGESAGGGEFVCVTLCAITRWPAVFDQIELYKQYAKGE